MLSKQRLTKIAALLFLITGTQFSFIKEFKYKSGDIIFLSNSNVPDKLLNAITKSKISHIGIVIKDKGKLSVCYAGAKVVRTSIPEFLALSSTGKYEVFRTKDTLLMSSLSTLMLDEANKLMGFPYDNKYSWLDMEIYNTELIWKIYRRASNIELCAVKPFTSIEISDTIVQKKVKLLYNDTIPEFTKIVSPSDIYHSEFLVKVK